MESFVAYGNFIINIINTCCTPLNILAHNVIKIGIMNLVFLIFKLYAMVLKHFLDPSKQSRIYGDVSMLWDIW